MGLKELPATLVRTGIAIEEQARALKLEVLTAEIMEANPMAGSNARRARHA